MPTLRIPLDKGLCGAAATSGQTVAVNNVAADPRYLGSDLVKSNIVVPIFVKARVVAELCIESYFANAFPPQEQQFIESCAGVVGRFMEKGPTTRTGLAPRFANSLEVCHSVPHQLHRNRQNQKSEDTRESAHPAGTQALHQRPAHAAGTGTRTIPPP